MASKIAKNQLHQHPLYTIRQEFLSYQEQVELAYARARVVGRTWSLSLTDILMCSQKFWDMQNDPILVRDVGCNNILACHLNLFVGTVAPFAHRRPDLKPLLTKALNFDIIGNLLLTEVGHGLDISSLETTATKVEDGFVLHTPHPDAAKFMPPTTPIQGFPKFAIVFARLIVDDDYRGIRPFVVATSDNVQMCHGIKSIPLPPRCGSSPLDYSITTFNHVKIPLNALLGDDLSLPGNPHEALNRSIWRISIGGATLAAASTSALSMIAYIGLKYSQRRHVQGKEQERVPIMAFRTQQLPVVHAIASAYVLRAWRPYAIAKIMDESVKWPSRNAMSVIFKTTALRLLTSHSRDVGERLGAQGTFNYNLISQIEMDGRGISIAEGDILVLCIRLFTELLLERYEAPCLDQLDSVLGRHYKEIYSKCKAKVQSFPLGHRDPLFNQVILPQAEEAVFVLGQALAYSSAAQAGVPSALLTLFEIRALQKSSSIYLSKSDGIETRDLEGQMVNKSLHHVTELTNNLNIQEYVSSPIISDASWKNWISQLQANRSYEGSGRSNLEVHNYVGSKL